MAFLRTSLCALGVALVLVQIAKVNSYCCGGYYGGCGGGDGSLAIKLGVDNDSPCGYAPCGCGCCPCSPCGPCGYPCGWGYGSGDDGMLKIKLGVDSDGYGGYGYGCGRGCCCPCC